MGASYHAYAVIGIKLSKNELFKPKRYKAFEHNYPDDWSHDPKSGRDLWKSYPACILEGVKEIDGEIAPGIQGVSQGTDSGPYYLGLVAGVNQYDADGFLKLDDKIKNFEELKKRLEYYLKPYDLWLPERFGIYAVFYCAY